MPELLIVKNPFLRRINEKIRFYRTSILQIFDSQKLDLQKFGRVRKLPKTMSIGTHINFPRCGRHAHFFRYYQ